MDASKEIFKTVTDALEALDVYEWVDLNKGQMARPQEHYPFGFPSAFVSTGRMRLEDMTHDLKEGDNIIEVLIAFDKYGDTFAGAVDQEESLVMLDTLAATAKALHWLTGETFEEITQTGREDLTERYGRPTYKLIYTTVIRYNLND